MTRANGVAWHLGRVPYLSAWRLQQGLHRVRVERASDASIRPHSLLVLEHSPVYTLGRGSTLDHLHFDPSQQSDVELYRVERGGQVTYHGPGQCTLYPICDLRDAGLKQDLHWYVTGIEETIIKAVAHYGVAATRCPGKPGVWVHDSDRSTTAPSARWQGGKDRRPWRKIAAVGMACSKWVTYHGMAVNVGPSSAPGQGLDMSAWSRIVPCGIGDEDKGVTSLAQELEYRGATEAGGDAPSMVDFQQTLLNAWSDVFNMDVSSRQGWPTEVDEPGMHLQREESEEEGQALGHMKVPRALR